jgi:hypothetical protein
LLLLALYRLFACHFVVDRDRRLVLSVVPLAAVCYVVNALLFVSVRRFVAFHCFANLLMKQHVFVFFQMDPSTLKRYYAIYDHLLENHNPRMFAQIKKLQIVNEMYLFPWFQVRSAERTCSLADRAPPMFQATLC